MQYSLVEYTEILNQYAGKEDWGADKSWERILEWQLQIPELLKSSVPQIPPPGHHDGHLLLHFNPGHYSRAKVCRIIGLSVALQVNKVLHTISHTYQHVQNKGERKVKLKSL